MAVRFTPDRVELAAPSLFPRGAQRPVVRGLLHRGCMSTPDLFMRRFAGETFDPKRGERKRFGRGGKVG